ncbi:MULTISPECIES: phosphonate utilization transcriptional regulator PhnR [unclassified Endozoicomonas]|uniref:phosphonate utilization transcriptional regulator PhnR n=1 Tax=unclassified Endozoicomonas TaxID=2644528 RepID=UPI00214880B7|nr:MULTISPECIES: phosphonate utilization transcriptional regulator PhnR [unclassified Endozoicomonas]
MGQGKNQYQIIRTALHEQIESGALKPGSKLPSERLLSEKFSTTRITLRESLSSLEADGLVYREDRRGWFVSPERVTYDPTVNANFHTIVTHQGRVPGTRMLHADLVPAPTRVQKLLQIPALTPVYRLQRLRSVDGRNVLYVENYMNPAYFPDLLQHDLSRSLSDIYQEHYNRRYARVSFRLYPVGLNAEASSHLKVTTGSSGLLVERTNYDQSNLLIDCDFEYWRQDAVVIAANTTINPMA